MVCPETVLANRKKYSKNSVGVRIEEELVKENLVRFFHLRAEPLAPLLYEQGRADVEQGLELPDAASCHASAEAADQAVRMPRRASGAWRSR